MAVGMDSVLYQVHYSYQKGWCIFGVLYVKRLPYHCWKLILVCVPLQVLRLDNVRSRLQTDQKTVLVPLYESVT